MILYRLLLLSVFVFFAMFAFECLLPCGIPFNDHNWFVIFGWSAAAIAFLSFLNLAYTFDE